MGKTKTAVATTGALCAALVAPALAAAAVTIGGDLSASGNPTPCGAAACEVAQISLTAGQTVAPFDGVVVRWRVHGGTGPLALRVLRTIPSTANYTFVSTSALERPASTGVETFATRQPIRAGDYVGLEGQGVDARIPIAVSGNPGDAIAAWIYVPDGHVGTPEAYAPEGTIAYDADVEPDADHDGYGDETQDGCPSAASTQGACPPPPPAPAPAATASSTDTTPARLSTTARSARLSARGAIAFSVGSNEHVVGSATGTVEVPGQARAVRFAKRAVSLAASRSNRVTLTLGRHSAALVRAALAHGERLRAAVWLSVRDAAGNPSRIELSLALRR